MTQDELAIVKEALLDLRYANYHVSLLAVKRNQQAMKIITLEQIKLHNAELKK